MHSTKLTIDACLNYHAYGEKRCFAHGKEFGLQGTKGLSGSNGTQPMLLPRKFSICVPNFSPGGLTVFESIRYRQTDKQTENGAYIYKDFA